MHTSRIVTVFIVVLTLSGCGHFGPKPKACPDGMQEMWQAQLLFGRNIGGTLGVSDDDWRRFVDQVIAPRFPAGFTISDASGVWRGANGMPVHEPSKVLMVAAPAGPETRAQLDAIAAAYRTRFHQEAVGIVVRPVCAVF
jgi:Protein of unknown function (DUF3574)